MIRNMKIVSPTSALTSYEWKQCRDPELVLDPKTQGHSRSERLSKAHATYLPRFSGFSTLSTRLLPAFDAQRRPRTCCSADADAARVASHGTHALAPFFLPPVPKKETFFIPNPTLSPTLYSPFLLRCLPTTFSVASPDCLLCLFFNSTLHSQTPFKIPLNLLFFSL